MRQSEHHPLTTSYPNTKIIDQEIRAKQPSLMADLEIYGALLSKLGQSKWLHINLNNSKQD